MSVIVSTERRSLLERVAIRQALEHREIVSRCREWVISHKSGPMYWARNWTKTENFQWQAQGLQPKAPFPYKPYRDREVDLKALPFPHDLTLDDPPDYLDIAMGYMLVSKELWIPKTREMMTSWLVILFITWFCQFYDTTGWIAQSEDDDKAKGLVKYANTLYANQPEWMRTMFPLKSGENEGTLHQLEWANGSWFQGVPSGERKLASRHPHGYFNDESAHQPGVERTRGIALPAVRQSLFVSSVAPGYFWDNAQHNGKPTG